MKKLENYLRNPLINVAEICRRIELSPAMLSMVLKGQRKFPKSKAWETMEALCDNMPGQSTMIEGQKFTYYIDHFIVEQPIDDLPWGDAVVYQPEPGTWQTAHMIPTARINIYDNNQMVKILSS
jgi:hypothetical protein